MCGKGKSGAPGLYGEERPWGSFRVLADELRYKVKIITVQPGKRLSLQLHRRRQEHWYFIQGQGVVTRGGEEIPVAAGVAVDIPREAAHRVGCQGEIPLMFVETQTGDYFGEDDIVRLEDDFGRA
jgi:mannose-6-phosphate isomerase